jgi:hypothetical protein
LDIKKYESIRFDSLQHTISCPEEIECRSVTTRTASERFF